MLFGGINYLTMWPHSLWKDNDIYLWLFSSCVALTDYPPDSSKGLQDHKSQNLRKRSSEWEGNMLQNILSAFSPTGVHYSWAYRLKILLSCLYFHTLLTFDLPDWKKKKKNHHATALKATAILSSHVRQKANRIWFESTQ